MRDGDDDVGLELPSGADREDAHRSSSRRAAPPRARAGESSIDDAALGRRRRSVARPGGKTAGIGLAPLDVPRRRRWCRRNGSSPSTSTTTVTFAAGAEVARAWRKPLLPSSRVSHSVAPAQAARDHVLADDDADSAPPFRRRGARRLPQGSARSPKISRRITSLRRPEPPEELLARVPAAALGEGVPPGDVVLPRPSR